MLSDAICILPQQLSDADLAGPLQKEIQKLQEMRAQRQTAAARESALPGEAALLSHCGGHPQERLNKTPSRSAAALDPEEEWDAMLPELKSTLQQLLRLPQEEVDEQIADTETAEEVKGRIRQLLSKASYKYVKEQGALRVCGFKGNLGAT